MPGAQPILAFATIVLPWPRRALAVRTLRSFAVRMAAGTYLSQPLDAPADPVVVRLFAPFPFPFLLSVPPALRSTRARLSRLSFAWGPSPSVAATGPSKPFDSEAVYFAPDTTCFRFLPSILCSLLSTVSSLPYLRGARDGPRPARRLFVPLPVLNISCCWKSTTRTRSCHVNVYTYLIILKLIRGFKYR
ncbi:hypothetical protein DFH06DRAFT_1196612 [Mycena polygramma]|nr:hypothetical protein DFH06DRAFT_1196612 [Mycena polygramma]